MLKFSLTHSDGIARCGTLELAHGTVETPNFMTVGTLGALKGVTHEQVETHGSQVMLMNAFHLAWRPGEKTVQKLGGLHKFTGWKKPILTDSGGYQIFSLPGLRKITDEGALFASIVDGTQRMFSPEEVVDISCALAPDMAMVLDECPAYPFTPEALSSAVDRSARWAERSVKRAKEVAPEHVNFFGIVQGGFDEKERQRSLELTAALPFPGLALGGFCVGEPIEDTHRAIAFTAPKMPTERPRYLMGMGTPIDILHSVAHGIDLFDCTMPTRNGRNGTMFTSQGIVRMKNAKHAQSDLPLDPACQCYTCKNFSRGYLRHLKLAGELNAAILLSLHNLAFYLNLMKDIREAIKGRRLAAFTREFLARWSAGSAEEPLDADDE